MTEFFKYAGLALIAVAAILTARRYDAYTRRRLAVTESFLRLLRHVRGRIFTFLEPLPRAVRSFSDEMLESVGFLGAVREGACLSDAFSAVAERCSLGAVARELIGSTFASLGRGTREETVAFTDSRISELTELLEQEREELARSVKLTRTLMYAAALGIIILFV